MERGRFIVRQAIKDADNRILGYEIKMETIFQRQKQFIMF